MNIFVRKLDKPKVWIKFWRNEKILEILLGIVEIVVVWELKN